MMNGREKTFILATTLPEADQSSAMAARQCQIDRHLLRNARRKRRRRVVRDTTLAVCVSAMAFGILQLAIHGFGSSAAAP